MASQNITCKLEVERVEQWIEERQDAAADGDPMAVAEALGNMIDGNTGETVKEFAKFCESVEDSNDEEHVQLRLKSNTLRQLVEDQLATLLKSQNYLNDIMYDYRSTVEDNSLAEHVAPDEQVQKLHDDAYWSDPDNQPLQVSLLALARETFDVLSTFGGAKEKMCNEAMRVCSSHFDFWVEMKSDLTPQHTASDQFRRLLVR